MSVEPWVWRSFILFVVLFTLVAWLGWKANEGEDER